MAAEMPHAGCIDIHIARIADHVVEVRIRFGAEDFRHRLAVLERHVVEPHAALARLSLAIDYDRVFVAGPFLAHVTRIEHEPLALCIQAKPVDVRMRMARPKPASLQPAWVGLIAVTWTRAAMECEKRLAGVPAAAHRHE